MRQIDADKLIEFFEGRKKETNKLHELVFLDAVNAVIDNQPTAYDVDKVVEQLKVKSFERYSNDGMGGELVVNLDDVIEILKGGGKDE